MTDRAHKHRGHRGKNVFTSFLVKEESCVHPLSYKQDQIRSITKQLHMRGCEKKQKQDR